MVLEAGSPKIRVLAGSVPGESLLPPSPHLTEGVRELPGVSFLGALIPFPRAPRHSLIPPKGPACVVRKLPRFSSRCVRMARGLGAW